MNEKMNELLLKIDTIMDNLLEAHGFTAVSSGLEEEFGWYSNEDSIAYSLLVCEPNDSAFNHIFFDYLGCKYDVGTFWASWFHELGHSETFWSISDTNWRDVPDTLEEYLVCPREIIASKWAVEYINTHIEDVKELAREVDELRRQIYSL